MSSTTDTLRQNSVSIMKFQTDCIIGRCAISKCGIDALCLRVVLIDRQLPKRVSSLERHRARAFYSFLTMMMKLKYIIYFVAMLSCAPCGVHGQDERECRCNPGMNRETLLHYNVGFDQRLSSEKMSLCNPTYFDFWKP